MLIPREELLLFLINLYLTSVDLNKAQSEDWVWTEIPKCHGLVSFGASLCRTVEPEQVQSE